MPEVSIVIPAYNEEAAIREVVTRAQRRVAYGGHCS